MANSIDGVPILSAFVLGLIGALAPCQITGNLGAMTIYGNRSVQQGIAWREIVFFVLGKIVVFTVLGLIVWALGREFQQTLTAFFPVARKLIGPMLIFIGLFMAGFIHLKGTIDLGFGSDSFSKHKGSLGAFLMGASFSLAFCPTMFVLFFLTLMPLVLSASYGVILPGVFAVATSIPLLVLIVLIWYLGGGGTFMKKSRKVGMIVQRIAGWLLIVIGILDTITYWSI